MDIKFKSAVFQSISTDGAIDEAEAGQALVARDAALLANDKRTIDQIDSDSRLALKNAASLIHSDGALAAVKTVAGERSKSSERQRLEAYARNYMLSAFGLPDQMAAQRAASFQGHFNGQAQDAAQANAADVASFAPWSRPVVTLSDVAVDVSSRTVTVNWGLSATSLITNKEAKLAGTCTFTYDGKGKIEKEYTNFDPTPMLVALGVIPAPPSGTR